MVVELNHRVDGSGPRVLLLHAVGMDLTLLDALAAILAKQFTVLRADLRGHGRSPYAPAASLEDYADDVHALLTKLSFGPCAVAGFAMGGMVTQALAVKYPQDTRDASSHRRRTSATSGGQPARVISPLSSRLTTLPGR